jgi:hypothetical protein
MFAFNAPILSVLLSTLVFLVFEAHGFGIRPGTYMPMNETDRGKNLKSIKSFSERVAEMHKQGGHLTLIFGFSTGHVGTTTLCTPAAYNADEIAQNNVKFLFERAGVPPAVCGKRDWDMKKEIQHVEYYYGPEILTDVPLTGKSTIVDLSHANICFYRGLIHVLHRENIPFKFIRIRRERLETAVSMSIQFDDTVDFFGRDYYRFHPFEAQHLTHLRIPAATQLGKSLPRLKRFFGLSMKLRPAGRRYWRTSLTFRWLTFIGAKRKITWLVEFLLSPKALVSMPQRRHRRPRKCMLAISPRATHSELGWLSRIKNTDRLWVST